METERGRRGNEIHAVSRNLTKTNLFNLTGPWLVPLQLHVQRTCRRTDYDAAEVSRGIQHRYSRTQPPLTSKAANKAPPSLTVNSPAPPPDPLTGTSNSASALNPAGEEPPPEPSPAAAPPRSGANPAAQDSSLITSASTAPPPSSPLGMGLTVPSPPSSSTAPSASTLAVTSVTAPGSRGGGVGRPRTPVSMTGETCACHKTRRGGDGDRQSERGRGVRVGGDVVATSDVKKVQ